MIQPHHYQNWVCVELSCGDILDEKMAKVLHIEPDSPCAICDKYVTSYKNISQEQLKKIIDKIEAEKDRQLQTVKVGSTRKIETSFVLIDDEEFFQEAAKGFDPNSRVEKGEPLLCHAVRKSSWRVIHALLEMNPTKEIVQEAFLWITGKLNWDAPGYNYEAQDFYLRFCSETNLELNGHYLGSANEVMFQIAQKLKEHGAENNLHTAAAMANREFLLNYINSGGDLNAPGPDNCTALGWAARRGQFKIVEMLLKHGAKVNGSDCDTLPIHDAVKSGDSSTLKLIIEAKGNLNAYDDSGNTPIMLANNNELLEILLKKGADPNKIGCLWESFSHLNTEKASLLLKYGANPNQLCSKDNTTPFFVKAIKSMHWDQAANLILHGVDLSLKNRALVYRRNGSKIECSEEMKTPLEQISRQDCLNVFFYLAKSDKNVPEQSRTTIIKKIDKIHTQLLEEEISMLLSVADHIKGKQLLKKEPTSHKKNIEMLESLKKRLTSGSTS